MRFHYSASALALITSAVLAQDCPSGFHRGTIEWYDCPVAGIPTLQCATLDVPLDYQKPSGDILELRLVRVPASANPRNKTVMYNPGGPGIAGIANFIGNGNGLDLQKLVGLGYNVLSFDPRGTGLTIPFQCESTSNLTDFKSTQSDLVALQGRLQTQATACADPADKADNVLMGTAYVANDIKSIAAALGEDGLIRYLGYSYGTLLGSTTAALFPDYIDRMVLDGNINPKDYYYGLGAEAVADFDKAVARFFELCAAAGPQKCSVAVADQTGDQLQKNFDNFLSNITDHQSYNLRSEFFDVLYAPYKFTEWSTTLKGYYDAPAKVSMTKRQAEPEGEDEWKPTQSFNSDLGLQGVTCADWEIRPAGTLANFQSWLQLYTSTSRYGGDQSLLTTTYQCALWQNDALQKPQSPFTSIKTKTPILFANGQYDPVTPLVSAQNSSSGFIHSRVLVSSGSGHCTSAQPSKELNAAIMQYFDDASFPTVEQIYTPSLPNPFIANVKTTSTTNTTTTASNSTVKTTTRRAFTIPAFFNKNKNIITRRQSTIPVGCVAKAGNGTSSAPSSMKSGSPYNNSTKTGASYPTGVGYPNSPYQTAKVSIYSIGNNNNYGYNTYPGSKPSAVPCPSGYKPVTSVVTKTVCNTVTACPYGGNCQIGQVITKTVTKTSINYVATIPGVPATIKYTPASRPGQGYSVAKTTTKAKKTSTSVPVYGSNAKPSSPAAPVYPASNPAAPVYPAGTPAAPAAPGYSAAKTPAAASSAKTVATGTPVGGYPAQFTGAASSDRAALSFVGFFAAFALFAFNL